MEGRRWRNGAPLSPVARLKSYLDPKTGLPVILGRALLLKYVDSAQGGADAAKRWAYMPWNWHHIALEGPRGLVKTPLEILTGRNPNQHGYVGRGYMYRGEGGATVRRGQGGK